MFFLHVTEVIYTCFSIKKLRCNLLFLRGVTEILYLNSPVLHDMYYNSSRTTVPPPRGRFSAHLFLDLSQRLDCDSHQIHLLQLHTEGSHSHLFIHIIFTLYLQHSQTRSLRRRRRRRTSQRS